MSELKRALGPVKRRMRAQRTFQWTMYGLFAGMVCLVLMRIASFLWVFPSAMYWGLGALAATPALFSAVSWLWPITEMDAARQADALGLKARAQTAVMLHGCDTPMAQLQRGDALKSLRALEPKRHMRLRIPRLAWIGALACACLLGASYLIPNPQAEALKARAAFHAEMLNQAKKLDDGAAGLDAKEVETPELRRLLGELSSELRRAEDVRDALSAVDATERKVSDLQQRTAKDALDAMKAAGLNTLAQALLDGDGKAAQVELEALKTAASQLSQAAAKATTATAAGSLRSAAQAMSAGNVAQALSSLQTAATGQTSASAQALALAGMVRSAAASAAQQGGMQAGAQGMGQSGSQPGAGAGNQGQGGSGPGAGLGSSNKDGGMSLTRTATGVAGKAAPELKIADYEPIYDPTRLGGSGETVNERGPMGEGEIYEAEAGTGVGSAGDSVPYRQVLGEYQQTAVEAVQSAQLPAYAQKWVQDYFDALAQ
ncbi:MAG: hypothetical protein MRZ54_05865 [Clostridiales bacterium]|nr:hypothetical protein [Clostridiales bacterium]